MEKYYKAIVRIFGVQASGCNPAKTWQAAANLAKKLLTLKFGEQVDVEYIDFLPPKWKEFPKIINLINKGQIKIPIVMVNDEIISSGGKINVSQIEKHLLNTGLKRINKE
ncbi:MAG: hypothetical protein NC822_01740 [Candidatus Omnitrophica bacterium]|nr:hypothetical protein [Candidatus Omnitrophota bacterium]MCM8827416.1 hypothetical protein [Candidatus Omnitrophota bacterium]